MRVCILGNGLSSLALSKALVNEKIYVDLFYTKKIQKISQSRTIGISKKNINFFNKHIINIDNFIWKLNEIHIFSDNLKNEKLLNFKNNNDQLFSVIRNLQLHEILEKNLKKNKYFKKIKINTRKKSDSSILVMLNFF